MTTPTGYTFFDISDGITKDFADVFSLASPPGSGSQITNYLSNSYSGLDLGDIFAPGTGSGKTTNYFNSINQDLGSIFVLKNTWSALGSGCSNTVYTIAIDSLDNVYVGGSFISAGGITVNRIAKWDGSSWSALGTGVSGIVHTITIDSSNNLYVGGEFEFAGGITVNRIAKWDGSNWSALGTLPDVGVVQTPVSALVNTIKINSLGALYVGGNFFKAGASIINFIAIYTPSTNNWSTPGTGFPGGIAKSIAIDVNDNVYAGTLSSSNLFIFTFSTSTWSSSVTQLFYINTVSLDVTNTNIYVGGAPILGLNLPMIYKSPITSFTWSEYITSNEVIYNNGFNSINIIIIDSSNDVYVGGAFLKAGTGTQISPPTQDVNNITKSDNIYWYALGVGTNAGTSNIVYSIAINSSGIIYAGGSFITAGGISASNIAKYTP